jgi:tetratricopeptide (TPR) repeat protein
MGSIRLRLVVAVALLAVPGSVGAAELDDVHAELDEINESLTKAEHDDLAPESFESQHKLTARLSDGQLFFVTHDYVHAAMVLLDVVEDAHNRSHPAYRDALAYLAESLYQIGTYKLAAQWFEEVTRDGTPEQQQIAMGRLLEIALQTGDVKTAETYLARASQLLTTHPDARLLYALGKYYYLTGSADRAFDLFARIPDDHELALRARYFQGVVLIRRKQLTEALQVFQKIVATPNGRPNAASDDAQVVDLARLATARIDYELEKFDDAVAAYAAVNRDSSQFDQALYESVWISIKQGAYEKALRKLDILLISQPDVVKGPDTRILQGQLLNMLDRYDDAALAFQEVLFEFGPIQTEMREIVRKAGGDLAKHFQAVIGQNLADFDLASFLPERAAEFAGQDAEADRALKLVRDLAEEKRDLDDAQRTIQRLQVAVNAPNRVEIFPRLHDGWMRALEAKARLTTARGRLNAIAGRHVDTPEYVALRRERERVGKLYAAIPKSIIELQARDAKVDDQMIKLDQEAYKLGIQIGAMEAQLVAVDKYIADVTAQGGEVANAQSVREDVQRELEAQRALRDELQAVQHAIEADRIQVGVNDEATAQDERVRRSYEAALDAEEAWLHAHQPGGIDASRARIDELRQRADGVIQRTSAIVDDKIADIKHRIAEEQVNVQGYDGELVACQGETQSLGGDIAARSFEHVQKRVDDVVLDADVGLVDVAWKQKEERSTQISDLLARKRAELEAVQRSYNEVTGE